MSLPRLSAPYIALLLAALCAGVGPAVAQSSKDLITRPESAQPQSTEITSDRMEMWSTDTETLGLFSGNVVVTGTNLKITCDRLEITATRIGDKTATIPTLEKFKFLLATGKVRIVQGDREATCGRAEVYPREDKIVLKEEPMVEDRGIEVTYVGRELELLRGERRVRGEGVHITGPNIKDLGFDKGGNPVKTETPATNAAPAATEAAPAAPAQTQTPVEQPK